MSAILACYSSHSYGIYTLADGTLCDTAYVCNDKPSAPKPPGSTSSSTTTTTTRSASPTPTVSFAHRNQGPGVQLNGEWTLDQLFAPVKLSDGGAPGTQYCPGLDSPADLKGSGKYGEPYCTIAVECGPLNGPAMLSVAKRMLAASKLAHNTTTQELDACAERASCFGPNDCFYECEQKADCYCSGEADRERKVTNLARGDVRIGEILLAPRSRIKTAGYARS